MSLDPNSPQYAQARFHITIQESWNSVPNIRCAGVLLLQKDLPGAGQPAFLYAPDPFTYYGKALENLFLHPKNSPFFAVNRSGNSFSFNGPLYLIMKGVSPTFLNGKEIKIQITSQVSGGAGAADFYNTATFDPLRPILLYSSTTNSIIYLPEGSTYNSSAGMGIPSTPTEPTPNPPSPNPMTWAVRLLPQARLPSP